MHEGMDGQVVTESVETRTFDPSWALTRKDIYIYTCAPLPWKIASKGEKCSWKQQGDGKHLFLSAHRRSS